MESFVILIASVGHLSSYLVLGSLLSGILGCCLFLMVSYFVHLEYIKWTIFSGLVALAIPIIQAAEMSLGSTDPSYIILDEFIAVPFIYFGYRLSWHVRDWVFVPVGLIMYGLIDRFKPFGITYVENFPGGFGVVSDDLTAALLTGLFLIILLKLKPAIANDNS